MFRAVIIDPFLQTVAIRTHKDWNPGEVYRTVGSPDIGYVQLTPNVKMLTDEFGMYRKEQQWFSLGNFPPPVAGRALLIGTTPSGETTDVPFTSPATIKGITRFIVAPLALSLAELIMPGVIDKSETLPMPDIKSFSA